MKKLVKVGGRTKRAIVRAQFLTLLYRPALAIAYCRAAQRDETDGYPFTAAMERRKAAELLAFIPAVAERCWMQWERIMRLPHRLARPFPSAGTCGAPQTCTASQDVELGWSARGVSFSRIPSTNDLGSSCWKWKRCAGK